MPSKHRHFCSYRLAGLPRNAKARRRVAVCCGGPSPAASPTRTDCERIQVDNAATQLQPEFQHIDRVVAENIKRVTAAFHHAGIHASQVDGLNCAGRTSSGQAALDAATATIMGSEAATTRSGFWSGTHAISATLFACARPGSSVLFAAGAPYDTLEEVVGSRGTAGRGSLNEWGVGAHVVPLLSDGAVDLDGLASELRTGKYSICHIQRSCGYHLRPSLTIEEVACIVQAARDACVGVTVTVDNCYGEFTEAREPGHVGADLVVGSMIKNPGGTFATGGAYVAGRRALVDKVLLQLQGHNATQTALPAPQLQNLLQGWRHAPAHVGEALKGGRLIAKVMDGLGLEVEPKEPVHVRPSFITAVRLGSEAAMLDFCATVQSHSPVGSYVRPVPGVTPGYGDPVVFSDGTFIDGSTSELSADGPLRPPFVVYCQGGTHWLHWAIILRAYVASLAATEHSKA